MAEQVHQDVPFDGERAPLDEGKVFRKGDNNVGKGTALPPISSNGVRCMCGDPNRIWG